MVSFERTETPYTYIIVFLIILTVAFVLWACNKEESPATKAKERYEELQKKMEEDQKRFEEGGA